MPSSSARVSTRPAGLPGVLTTIARVVAEDGGQAVEVERLAGQERHEDRLASQRIASGP